LWDPAPAVSNGTSPKRLLHIHWTKVYRAYGNENNLVGSLTGFLAK